jgi:protein-tyrosine phosphatase
MNVLFVCHGNICRSPLAKALLKKKYKEHGVKSRVESAGFESYFINEPPDQRVIELGEKHGLSISDNAKIFRKQDFDKYDKIYVMDTQNFRDVKDLARSPADIAKIDYLMNVLFPGKNQTIGDPFMSGLNDLQSMYDLLDKVTDKILKMAFAPEKI